MLLNFIFIFTVVPFSAWASPMPPSAKCRIEAQFVKNLGVQSILHKSLWSEKKENRPFQCKEVESTKDYRHELVKIRILKAKLLQEGYGNSDACPKLGIEIDVIAGKELLPAKFSANFESRGDECFFANYLSQIQPLK